MHVGGLFYLPITRNTRLSVLVLKGLPSPAPFYIFLVRIAHTAPLTCLPLSFCKDPQPEDSRSPDVNLSRGRVRARARRRRSFDHRRRASLG